MHKAIGVVVVFSVLVALSTAGYMAAASYIHARKVNDMKARFHVVEEQPRGQARPDDAIALLGYEEGRRFLRGVAERSDVFSFDGDSRFVQIVHEQVRYDGPATVADGLQMSLIGKGDTAVRTWLGPPGTRIDSVEFEADGLLVHLLPRKEPDGLDRPETNRVVRLPWAPHKIPDPPPPAVNDPELNLHSSE